MLVLVVIWDRVILSISLSLSMEVTHPFLNEKWCHNLLENHSAFSQFFLKSKNKKFGIKVLDCSYKRVWQEWWRLSRFLEGLLANDMVEELLVGVRSKLAQSMKKLVAEKNGFKFYDIYNYEKNFFNHSFYNFKLF